MINEVIVEVIFTIFRQNINTQSDTQYSRSLTQTLRIIQFQRIPAQRVWQGM